MADVDQLKLWVDNEVSVLEEPRPGWYVLGVLSLLMGFASISTDLYLPAMPLMSSSLHAGTGLIEWTISGYLVGFSFGQLLWGPLSDRYGRRLAIGSGLILFVLGSVGCALSNDALTLIAWRVVQALGACASVALSRAMVRDLYEGTKAAQMLSTLITVMAVMPLVGPLLGGQIVWMSGWRAIFWFLVAVGLVTLGALCTIPETLPQRNRNTEPLGRALFSYFELLRNRRLLGYLGAGGFLYAGMFAYVAGTPFVYISYYHFPARLYGLLFGMGIIGIMGANILNRWLIGRFGYDRILVAGAIAASATGMWAGFAAHSGLGGLWGLVMPLFLFASTTGLIVANSITGALTDFPQRAGAVSALTGAVQYGSGIFGSGLVGLWGDGTPWPLGLVVALSGVGCLLSTVLLLHSRK
ncbi:Multidrug resistance transporter, Bcr/CflA family [Citrifermentans bremense]|uniref:Multidrug resistance transporter, Bcr/CflA family n=1 Tax=Citrifermentans bremense TaxID=60035 RepID=A0A6S6M5Q8_9BACT|nr:multidrug effflux MFS transporter [Citrifermentans bremense]BCG47226.1 Multidrug resistance transporter, Bcr/CflA family [Citrifermentans bremense]